MAVVPRIVQKVMLEWLARTWLEEQTASARENERVNIADKLRLAGYPDIAYAVHVEGKIPEPPPTKPVERRNRGLNW